MSQERNGSFAWNYETTYYHIHPKIDLLDGVLDPIFLEIPRSAENDADVQGIVDALNRIASRMALETWWKRPQFATGFVPLLRNMADSWRRQGRSK
jgi:hypothetical protein